MWHTELDYAGSGVAGELSLARTYNSQPLYADSNAVLGFGSRWTYRYDAVLKQEFAFSSSPLVIAECWRWNDDHAIECANYVPSQLDPIPQTVSIQRGDGKRYAFNRNGQVWIGDANVNDRVTATFSQDGSAVVGWTYVSALDDSTERYDGNGVLISITSRSGAIQRLTYANGASNDTSVGRVPADAPACTHVEQGAVLPAGKLLCVTDNWGRQIQFEYDTAGRIAKAIDPAGGTYLYAYDGPSGGCATSGDTSNPACSLGNLTQVTFPDGRSKTYYYNEAAQINGGVTCTNNGTVAGNIQTMRSLTGVVDENGTRYLSWTYDCDGKATSSSVGSNVERVDLSYGAYSTNGGVSTATTTVTHTYGNPVSPQTTVTTYNYQMVVGLAKHVGMSGPCVECGRYKSRSYDANGNLASVTDWNNNVTTYVFDAARNLELTRVEASGTAQARTITTQWHPTYRLPAAIAEPTKITTYSYDGSGNLQTKIEQATTDVNGSSGLNAASSGTPRTWNYTYNGVGQMLTATDPVNNTTTYVYDSQGNLSTVTNALQQVTMLSNYDANGRVGTIQDPNGLVINLTYWPRGWLKTRMMGGETTSYDYDYAGQLTTVTLPDNSFISYTYDDAHRLTDIADSLGDAIHYTLDLRGNRTAEDVRDPNGVLARQVARVFDSLSRVQQVTGAAQ